MAKQKPKKAKRCQMCAGMGMMGGCKQCGRKPAIAAPGR